MAAGQAMISARTRPSTSVPTACSRPLSCGCDQQGLRTASCHTHLRKLSTFFTSPTGSRRKTSSGSILAQSLCPPGPSSFGWLSLRLLSFPFKADTVEDFRPLGVTLALENVDDRREKSGRGGKGMDELNLDGRRELDGRDDATECGDGAYEDIASSTLDVHCSTCRLWCSRCRSRRTGSDSSDNSIDDYVIIHLIHVQPI